MFRVITKGKRAKSAWLGLLCLAIVACVSGCENVSYYGQAVFGEVEILGGRKPVSQLLADPRTPSKLKERLRDVNKIRQFAARELKEPIAGAYVSYTELYRSNVAWNVNVAPPLSLDPVTWWYPFVGQASYRGYFHERAARRYASRWERQGWDVYVDGVEAYSTLGWFNDPLLSTFIYEPEPDLAELIFHELAHRRLFVNGDTDFDEAFATAVAAEGMRRWFASSGDTNGYRAWQIAHERERQFVQMVLETRQELQTVYADAKLTASGKLRRKEEIIARLRDNYAAIKKGWNGETGYDTWIASPINNAKLNTVSAYYNLTPAFTALIRAENGDMEKFYQAVAALGKLPIEKRHETLRSYLKPGLTQASK